MLTLLQPPHYVISYHESIKLICPDHHYILLECNVLPDALTIFFKS